MRASVFAYVFMCVFLRARAYICMCESLSVCVRACERVFMCARACMCVCVRARACVRACAHVHVCVCMRVLNFSLSPFSVIINFSTTFHWTSVYFFSPEETVFARCRCRCAFVLSMFVVTPSVG